MKASRHLIILIVVALQAVCSYAAAVQNSDGPVIVYLDGNDHQAVMRSDIDSITFCHYDADSVYHDEIVTQCIWTSDTVYRSELDKIEKVSFVAPRTVLKKNVVEIGDEMLRYIVRWLPDYSLLFALNTPESILPRVGENIFTFQQSDILPIGFMGRVNLITKDETGYLVECDAISYEDVFDSFFGTYNAESTLESQMSPSKTSRLGYDIDNTLSLPPLVLRQTTTDLGYEWDNGLSVGGNGQFSLSFMPSLRVKSMLFVGPAGKVYMNTALKYSIEGNLDFNASVNINKEKRIPVIDRQIAIPNGFGTRLLIEAGGLFNGKGEAGIELHHNSTFAISTRFQYSNQEESRPCNLSGNVQYITNDFTGSALGTAEINFGVYGDIGLSFLDKHFAKAALHLEGGLSLRLNAKVTADMLHNASSSTALYESLSQESNVEIVPYTTVSLEASALNDRLSASLELYNHGGYRPLLKGSLLPQLTNARFDAAHQRYTVSHGTGLITPASYSVAVYRLENGVPAQSARLIRDLNENDDDKSTLSAIIPIIEVIGSQYQAYPLVEAFGLRMLASPKLLLERDHGATAKAEYSNVRYYRSSQNYNSNYLLADLVIPLENLHLDEIPREYFNNIRLTLDPNKHEAGEGQDWWGTGYLYFDIDGTGDVIFKDLPINLTDDKPQKDGDKYYLNQTIYYGMVGTFDYWNHSKEYTGIGAANDYWFTCDKIEIKVEVPAPSREFTSYNIEREGDNYIFHVRHKVTGIVHNIPWLDWYLDQDSYGFCYFSNYLGVGGENLKEPDLVYKEKDIFGGSSLMSEDEIGLYGDGCEFEDILPISKNSLTAYGNLISENESAAYYKTYLFSDIHNRSNIPQELIDNGTHAVFIISWYKNKINNQKYIQNITYDVRPGSCPGWFTGFNYEVPHYPSYLYE